METINGSQDITTEKINSSHDITMEKINGSRNITMETINGSQDITKKTINGSHDITMQKINGSRNITMETINGSPKIIKETQESMSTLTFFVNGTKVTEFQPDPEMTLLTYVRTRLGLTGSKLGCGEGGCGACTVMVSHYNSREERIEHRNINACLAPVCSMQGQAVTTVEGICTKDNDYLHPVQERLAKFHGSQCGFCTPGIVMSMYTLLRNIPEPTAWEMESFFDGNLCRCTGYRPILDAFQTFTKEFKCGMGDQCCQAKQNGVAREGDERCKTNFQQKMMKTLKAYDPTQELIFPAELKARHEEFHSETLTFQNRHVTWVHPQSVSQLVELKARHPKAKLVCGNTEIGIETRFKNQKYPFLIYCATIPELCDVTVSPDGVTIGASVTLARMERELRTLIKTQPESKTRSFAAIVDMLTWFASHQIRNVATVSGNVMTASPISDLNPLFVACGATAHLKSAERGSRSLRMDNNFFQGYRKTAVAEDEILESITIPFTKETEYFQSYKQATRRDDDISLVNAGMNVDFAADNTIQRMTLAFGGMGVSVVLASTTAQAVIGDPWDDGLVSKVCSLLVDDLPLPPGSPGGVARFRKTVALSFFFKFFLSVKSQRTNSLDPEERSAIEPLPHLPSAGLQVVGARDSRQLTEDMAVGNALPHLSGVQQSKGEAIYVDDMPLGADELHLCLVTSTKANAKILAIDTTNAEAAEGFRGLVSASDMDGHPNSMSIFMDTVFASKEVKAQGQVILGVLGDTHTHAQRAAKLVKVDYEERTPILTIDDAIKADSFYDQPLVTSFGDLEAGFQGSDHVLQGTCRMNGQNHFYLETVATRATPLENGEMEIFCSTQCPSQVQNLVAENLGVPMSKILVRTKRLGGGFGGKETQSVYSAVPTAVAARKAGKTVRCVLDRDEDMTITGNRHPFLCKYKVGFTKDGKLLALDVELYCNAGNSMDLSCEVLAKGVLQFYVCFFVPHIRVVGKACRTNVTSNTAFRGFGSPQGHFLMEDVLEAMADFLNLRPMQIQERNFPEPEHPLRFSSHYVGDAIRNCWNMCLDRSDYLRRRQEVDDYNRANRWKKKGLALTPMKFGISFLKVQMNQAGALVHIYYDGSVLLAHAGTEMGQGLFVKTAQVASEVLGIPISRIHISEASTGTVPNTMPTAASVGSDLNGMAVKNACETLNERLRPFKEKNPKGTWNDWVLAAHEDRVSLSATGFFKTPGLEEVDYDTGKGDPHAYSTLGAACTEVQIDCLTGDHQVLRTDIVMDIGKSLNPAIDVGQIQGAFMQGYGLFMLEELKVSPSGFHFTQGPGTYKIPSFGNIPTQFNVHVVPDGNNPFAIFGSKGIGEPPLLLASSAFYAARDAIRSARLDTGKQGAFRLDSPATPANIRLACVDQFTDYFPEEVPGTFKPWFVDL